MRSKTFGLLFLLPLRDMGLDVTQRVTPHPMPEVSPTAWLIDLRDRQEVGEAMGVAPATGIERSATTGAVVAPSARRVRRARAARAGK